MEFEMHTSVALDESRANEAARLEVSLKGAFSILANMLVGMHVEDPLEQIAPKLDDLANRLKRRPVTDGEFVESVLFKCLAGAPAIEVSLSRKGRVDTATLSVKIAAEEKPEVIE